MERKQYRKVIVVWSRFSKVLNQVLVVTTPTETGARLIRPKLKVKVMAISSGIDLNYFNPLGDLESIRLKYTIPQMPVILFVGQLDPEKKIEEILQAVAVVAKKIDFRFVIVGKGLRKKALEQLTLELEISNNVIFTGYVPEEHFPFLYKLSRCFVIASIAELLSLATLQAMATGLPVIAANAGALPELVKHKMNGYLFNTNDIEKLSESIYEILTDDDVCFSMSEKSLQRAAQHDINKTVESFEKLYKSYCTRNVIEKSLFEE